MEKVKAMTNKKWFETLDSRELANAIGYCQSIIIDRQCLESGAYDNLDIFDLNEYEAELWEDWLNEEINQDFIAEFNVYLGVNL